MDVIVILKTLLSLMIASVATEFAIRWCSRVAIRIGLVDQPGGRKKHVQAMPLVGGLAMFMSFTFATAMLPNSLNDFRSFFAASGLLIFIGLLDDFRELSPKTRLVMQLIAALLMVLWGKNVIFTLGQPLGITEIVLGWSIGIPFTLFAVTALINAFNMLDGLDGLSGGIAFVQLSYLALLAYHSGQEAEMRILMVLLTCLAVFLRHNFPWHAKRRARVFMGDVGSMFLGFSLAWFAVWVPEQGGVIPPVVILWILGLPIVDSLQVVIHRMINRQSPLHPDREHLHHLLLRSGMQPQRTTLFMISLTALLSGLGFLGYYEAVPEPMLFGGFAGFSLCYCTVIWMFRKSIAVRQGDYV